MREQATTQLRSTVTSEGVSPLLLDRHSRLAKIDFKDLSRLAAASECQFVPRDNVIYRQGEPARGVYVVLDGSVRLERRGPTKAIVDSHQAGLYATFGDSVLRGEADRLYTATADAHSILVKLPQGLLEETLQSHPDIAGARTRPSSLARSPVDRGWVEIRAHGSGRRPGGLPPHH